MTKTGDAVMLPFAPRKATMLSAFIRVDLRFRFMAFSGVRDGTLHPLGGRTMPLKTPLRWLTLVSGPLLALLLAQASHADSPKDEPSAEPNFYLDLSREFVEAGLARDTDQ